MRSLLPHIRSLLPQNRSLLPQNRSLLPQNRSLLPQNRSLFAQTRSGDHMTAVKAGVFVVAQLAPHVIGVVGVLLLCI